MRGAELIILILSFSLPATAIQLPSIANVSLVPRFSKSITTLYNSSCDQCLCSALANASVAVNCFLNNNSCQLFAKMPISYRLQPNSQAILYFTNKTLPSPSQCCMPNTTQLIQKLHNATNVSVDLTSPRCLVIDDHGFLVTVQEYQLNFKRFHRDNLTLIDTTTFSNYSMGTVAYHQGAYFLGTQSDVILIVNSSSLSVINTFTAPGINAVRDMIFLHDGQTMVAASGNNRQIFFFNRSSILPRNYEFISNQSVSYNWPHGLWYVNDALFYVSSWEEKTIYSYATYDNGSTWNETLVVNATDLSSNRWGAHVMIDECQRFWLSTSNDGVLIYNSQGQPDGTFSTIWNGTFDAMFLDNYVMLLSDRVANKLIRLDPQIEC